MTLNPEILQDDSLASDMLWGVGAIAAFIKRKERPTYYGLQQGHLPGKKVGRIWTSSKTALRRRLTPTVDAIAG